MKKKTFREAMNDHYKKGHCKCTVQEHLLLAFEATMHEYKNQLKQNRRKNKPRKIYDK